MTDMSFEARSTYHEVGHAVACKAVGYKVTAIELGHLPICRYEVPLADELAVNIEKDDLASDPELASFGRAARRRQLLVAVSGMWCEAIAAGVADRVSFENKLAELFDGLDSGRRVDELIFETDVEDSDVALVFGFLWRLGRQDAIRELRDLEHQTRCLLADHWPEIEARVARILDELGQAGAGGADT